MGVRSWLALSAVGAWSALAAPARAMVDIGPEHDVATSSFDQSAPVIAATPHGYVVTWLEGVSVMAARLDVDARPLAEPTLVAIGKSPFHPAIAAQGSAALVAWVDSRGEYPDAQSIVLAVRLGDGLEPLDDPALELGAIAQGRGGMDSGGSFYGARVLFDGRQHVVAWGEGGFKWYGVVVARVSRDGAVTAGPEYSDDWYGGGPDVIRWGARTLAAWPGWSAVVAGAFVAEDDAGPASWSTLATRGFFYESSIRLATSGDGGVALQARPPGIGVVPLDADGFGVEADWSLPVLHIRDAAVAFDGHDYLIAYSRSWAGAEDEVRVTRLSTHGVWTEPEGIALSSSPDSEGSPDVASHGDGSSVAVYRRAQRVRARALRTTPVEMMVPDAGVPDASRASDGGDVSDPVMDAAFSDVADAHDVADVHEEEVAAVADDAARPPVVDAATHESARRRLQGCGCRVVGSDATDRRWSLGAWVALVAMLGWRFVVLPRRKRSSCAVRTTAPVRAGVGSEPETAEM